MEFALLSRRLLSLPKSKTELLIPISCNTGFLGPVLRGVAFQSEEVEILLKVMLRDTVELRRALDGDLFDRLTAQVSFATS